MPTNVDEAVVCGFEESMGFFVLDVELSYQNISVGSVQLQIPKSSVTTPAGWRAVYKSAITTFCTNNNCTTPTIFWIAVDGQLQSVYQSYQAIVAQSGTSAPTATVGNNDFGVTMTWARTAIGTYTLTASSSIFTAGKTAILISPSNSPLNNITGIRTSGTVITFTTSQINLLALGVGNVDSILAGLVEVRVYP